MAQERGPELLTYIIPIGLLIIMVCFLSRLAKQRVLAQSQGRNRIAKHERDKYQKAGLDQEIYHENLSVSYALNAKLAQVSARSSNITLWIIASAVVYSLATVRTCWWDLGVPVLINVPLDALVVDLVLVITGLILSSMLPTNVKGKKQIEEVNEDEQRREQEQCQQTLKGQISQQQQDCGQSLQRDATTRALSKNTEIIEKLNTIQTMLAELTVDKKDSARQHAQKNCSIKGDTLIVHALREDMTYEVTPKMQREHPKSGKNPQKTQEIPELKSAIKGRRKISLEELNIVKKVRLEENQKSMPAIPSFINTHSVDASAVPGARTSATKPIRNAEVKDNLQEANCIEGALATSISQPISDVSSTGNQLALKASGSNPEGYARTIVDQDSSTTQPKREAPSTDTWQEARVYAYDVKRDPADFGQAAAHQHQRIMLRRHQQHMAPHDLAPNMPNGGLQHSQEQLTFMHAPHLARRARQAAIHQPQQGRQKQMEQQTEERQQQLHRQQLHSQLMQTNQVYNNPFQKFSESIKQKMTQLVQQSDGEQTTIPRQQVDPLKMPVNKRAIREVQLLIMKKHQEQQQRTNQKQQVIAGGPVKKGQNPAMLPQTQAQKQASNMYRYQLQLPQMQQAMLTQPPLQPRTISSPTGISPSLPVAHKETTSSAKHPLDGYMKDLARLDEQNKERLSKARQEQDKASEEGVQMPVQPAVIDILSPPTRSDLPIFGNKDTKSFVSFARNGMGVADMLVKFAPRMLSSKKPVRYRKQMTKDTNTTYLQKLDKAQGEHDKISGVNQQSVFQLQEKDITGRPPPVPRYELPSRSQRARKLRRTMAPVRPMWPSRETITRAERPKESQSGPAPNDVYDAEEDTDSLPDLNCISSTDSLPDLNSVESTEERLARREPRLDLSALIQNVEDMTVTEAPVLKIGNNAKKGDSMKETKTQSMESKTNSFAAKPNCEPYLSYNEKCYIADAITQLDDMGNQEALHFVRNDMPNHIKDTHQTGIELDMDDLPNTVLLKLLTLLTTRPESWPMLSASTAASGPCIKSKSSSLSPGFRTSDPMLREPLKRSQAEANGAMQKPGPTTGGNHALIDYQRQLEWLEEQNKKRLMMARQEQDSISRKQEGASRADEDGFVIVQREDEDDDDDDDACVTVENESTSAEAVHEAGETETAEACESRDPGGLMSSRPSKEGIKVSY